MFEPIYYRRVEGVDTNQQAILNKGDLKYLGYVILCFAFVFFIGVGQGKMNSKEKMHHHHYHKKQ